MVNQPGEYQNLPYTSMIMDVQKTLKIQEKEDGFNDLIQTVKRFLTFKLYVR